MQPGAGSAAAASDGKHAASGEGAANGCGPTGQGSAPGSGGPSTSGQSSQASGQLHGSTGSSAAAQGSSPAQAVVTAGTGTAAVAASNASAPGHGPAGAGTASGTGTQGSSSQGAPVALPPSPAGAQAGSGGNGNSHSGSGGQTGAHAKSAPVAAPTAPAGKQAGGSSSAQPTVGFSLSAGGSQQVAGSSSGHGAAAMFARGAVTLPEASNAVRATFTAMNAAGVASARLTLTPATLGGLRISLSQTASGLIAHVIADHPEAAQVLLQNAGDLRRTLEASGMTLLALDISAAGDQSLGGFQSSNQSGFTRDGRRRSRSTRYVNVAATSSDRIESQAALIVRLTSGARVNVLA